MMTPNPTPDDSLEARLERVEAVLAIQQLEGEYCRRWDAGDGAGWADLYTEDGSFEAEPENDGDRFIAAGRDALAAMCTNFYAHSAGLHIIGLPDIELTSDGARARLHFRFRGMSRNSPPKVWDNYGHYEVTYVKTADGWRMARRIERAISKDTQQVFSGFYG
jgi:uncharacterized protein (TIGR02246 family)